MIIVMIDGSLKRLLNFRVCMFFKSAVIRCQASEGVIICLNTADYEINFNNLLLKVKSSSF